MSDARLLHAISSVSACRQGILLEELCQTVRFARSIPNLALTGCAVAGVAGGGALALILAALACVLYARTRRRLRWAEGQQKNGLQQSGVHRDMSLPSVTLLAWGLLESTETVVVLALTVLQCDPEERRKSGHCRS